MGKGVRERYVSFGLDVCLAFCDLTSSAALQLIRSVLERHACSLEPTVRSWLVPTMPAMVDKHGVNHYGIVARWMLLTGSSASSFLVASGLECAISYLQERLS